MSIENEQTGRNQKGEIMSIPTYLLSDAGCEKNAEICYGCDSAVKRNSDSGRWFITMGHPAFNSTANNGRGYKHRAAAERAIRKLAERK